MNQAIALEIVKLLSALESWGFSTKNPLPDFLHQDLVEAVEVLSDIVRNGNALAQPDRKENMPHDQALEIALGELYDAREKVDRLWNADKNAIKK